MEKPVLRVFSEKDALFDALARHLVELGNIAIEEKGRFNLVLSGGSSPIGLYSVLVSPSYSKLLDWSKVYFFFGDERYVPSDSKENNAYMARQLLFTPLEITEDRVFKVNTDLPPERAAQEYNQRINEHFKGQAVCFDCILLGLGDNVHVASLFPYTSILSETRPGVKAVYVPELEMNRISFTAPLINQAATIIFLVYGSEKAQAVKLALGNDRNPGKYPAQLIQPEIGNCYWYLDEAAAP